MAKKPRIPKNYVIAPAKRGKPALPAEQRKRKNEGNSPEYVAAVKAGTRKPISQEVDETLRASNKFSPNIFGISMPLRKPEAQLDLGKDHSHDWKLNRVLDFTSPGIAEMYKTAKGTPVKSVTSGLGARLVAKDVQRYTKGLEASGVKTGVYQPDEGVHAVYTRPACDKCDG